MKKLDKLGIVFNIILGILYIPLSLFSFLMQMASEMLFDATNPVYIGLVEISCVIFLVVSLLCPAGIMASAILRIKGHSKASFVTQFIPLAVFILNMIFLYFTEFIPATI